MLIGAFRSSLRLLLIGGFRSSSFRLDIVPSAVRLGTDRLLCSLIVGIHASGISIPLSLLMLSALVPIDRSILERREDLCMKGLRNTIETYGLLEPNPPPFQNTAMRRATIRSGMRLSLLTETHIGTPVGLKRLFT